MDACMHVRMNGWMDGQMACRMDGWMGGQTDSWMDEWPDGWVDGRMGGLLWLMDLLMDGCIKMDGSIYTTTIRTDHKSARYLYS